MQRAGRTRLFLHTARSAWQDEAENKRKLQYGSYGTPQPQQAWGAAPQQATAVDSMISQIFLLLRNLGRPGMSMLLDLIQPIASGLTRVLV